MEQNIGTLQALYKKQKNKPIVKFYEGVKELDNKEKEILGFASTKRLFGVMKNYNWPKWQKELKRRGIFLRDILVWDDKVAIMILDIPVFGTVIENQNLADTYRIQFDLMWKSLPRPQSIS